MVFNKYPYTDFHELNLDWILKEMQSLQEQMDGLLAKAIEEATKAAKEYVDEQLAGVMEQFATLQVSGLTGELAWATTGEVTKIPAVYVIQDGIYVKLD